MSDEGKKERRDFLNILLGGTLATFLGMIVYPTLKYLVPPKLPEANVSSVLVCKETEMAANTGKLFKFGRKPALLLETPEGELKAFIATCTHLDCTVQYRDDKKIIWCACHDGQYDLNGINIAGPPPRPLTPLKVHIKDGDIYVTEEA